MATTDRLLYISSDGLVRQLGFDPTAADLGGAAGVASSTHSATSKTTPVDADELPIVDSAASWGLKKLTWANLKATLATWIGGGTIAGSFTTLAASGNATLGDAEATDTHAIKGATTLLANSASAALTITQTGSGNALVVEDSTSPDSTSFVIDASGRAIVGGTAVITPLTTVTPQLQVQGTSASTSSALSSRFSNDANASSYIFTKSRNTSIGFGGAVASGDILGNLQWVGDDGASGVLAAQIRAEVDGTPGTNDMPGRLVFSTTADGASSPTERMRIDSAGLITVTGNLTTTGNATLGDATTDTLNVGNGGIIKDASNNVGFGASPAAGQRFRVGGTLTGSTNAYAQRNVVSVASDVTLNALGYDSTISTDATSFTLANLSHYYANQGTFGVGSAVTSQYGFRVASNMVGAANNYGFYGAIEAGSGRYNFYAGGTARNSFSGDVLIHGAGGMGYTTGSGGTVTQATSRTTGVTINKTNGAITLVSAAGSTSWQSFTVTNSLVAATDVVLVSQKSGTDKYMMHVTNVAAGSFQITFATTGGTTTEQPVFNVAVIKGATS